MGERILNWRVNYGDGETHDVSVPHAWRQDVDVRFEGPVVYSAEISVPQEPSSLWFEGVSYEAVVSVDGTGFLTHRGIWDAFELPLDDWAGKKIEVQVAVTKNGGERFPVKDVASGFLPYVYQTFGGIWGEVQLRGKGEKGLGKGDGRRETGDKGRVTVHGSKIYVEGEPFYIRGLLHWGWYPELGHHNAPEETIRREVREAKTLGFNLVKFCLWVPPHRYLEILKEEGMKAWLELPLWDPSSDPKKLHEIGVEIERIVRQYRHHDNIIVWTVGCELGKATPAEFRQYMVQMVKNLTGCPLVKDNSGGAEMYGGDLREYGDFSDFHPYCDTPFYPPVLDSLLPGPRGSQPILLGEFCDADVHRDIALLNEEMPYWASAMPELNEKGVRWQHDLPNFLTVHGLATGEDPARHQGLMESSRRQALFMRKTVHEWVRSRDPISGYVITGLRDTPISSAGFFDDWDRPRFSPEECWPWNGPNVLFLIPTRRPPWLDGGNRPGWMDPFNHFVGQVFFKVGIHSEKGLKGGLVWRIVDTAGQVIARGAESSQSVGELDSTEVGQISWQCDRPGRYKLEVEFGSATNSWVLYVEPEPDFSDWHADELLGDSGATGLDGPNHILLNGWAKLNFILNEGGKAILIADGAGPKAPFWREAAYEFAKDAPFANEWERLLAVSGDRVIDPEVLATLLPDGCRTERMVNRVDVRTYRESPVMIKLTGIKGAAIVTILRPHGGLGIQPAGLSRNAAGCALLRHLMELLK